MIEIEITLPAQHLLPVPELVEQAFAAEGLTVTLRGDLVQYPACTHWHAKRGKERGTLEATWWPQTNRLWLKIATGRSADWIPETAARLKSRIEDRLPHPD